MNRSGWIAGLLIVSVNGAGISYGQTLTGGPVMLEPPSLLVIPATPARRYPPAMSESMAAGKYPVRLASQVPAANQLSPITPITPITPYAPITPYTPPTSPSPFAPAASIAPSLPTSSANCCGTTTRGAGTVGQPIVSGYATAVPAPSSVYYSQPYRPVPMSCYSPAPTTVLRPVTSPAPAATGYYVGQGLIGQPKLYVNGQPVRNALRFISP